MAGCARDLSPAPLQRRLPASELIVPEPLARPAIRQGDDARLLARRALDYGDGNAARLRQARDAYEALRDNYATSAENPSP